MRRVASITANGKTTSLSYDYYGRVSEKREEGMVTQFSYTPWGRRSERTTTIDGKTLTREKRSYDKYGRLVLVDTGAHRMTCAYDEKNRLSTQTVDGLPIEITYTKYGQIEAKYFGGKARLLSTLRYEYDKKGRIVKKTQDGIEQNFSYDKKGQLVRVTDGQGRIAEEYAYDRAGNLAWKKEGGTLTEYSYDRANQLVSATKNGESTAYAYDAAGRMIREGSRGYRYAGADKVVSVEEKGKTIYRYDYWSDGQLAHAEGMDGVREEFLWDNLALIRRGAIEYLNEPSPTGGNPIAATGKVFFNDLLGTTVAAKGKEALEKLPVSAFGAAADLAEHQFFTGKPYVEGLGYAFLMRNYRSDLGKWQTADPLGYPDGWNAFAYCGNKAASKVDPTGLKWGNIEMYEYFKTPEENRIYGSFFDTDKMGLTEDIFNVIKELVIPNVVTQIGDEISRAVAAEELESGYGSLENYNTENFYPFDSICWSLGDGTVSTTSTDIMYGWEKSETEENTRNYTWMANLYIMYFDEYTDLTSTGLPTRSPYKYMHIWYSYPIKGEGKVKLNE